MALGDAARNVASALLLGYVATRVEVGREAFRHAGRLLGTGVALHGDGHSLACSRCGSAANSGWRSTILSKKTDSYGWCRNATSRRRPSSPRRSITRRRPPKSVTVAR